MRYPSIRSADAKKHILAVRNNVDSQLTEVTKGGGPELNQQFIEDLRLRLEEIRPKTEGPLSKGSAAGATFEATAAAIVHKTIPADAPMLADPEFWVWLSVIHFSDLIEWRYGSNPSGAHLANYGIGAAGENFMYRLWLRGELGRDESRKDEYALTTRGDIDFWRSHLFRQGYANARVFARALIEFQYPDASPSKPRLKLAEIREVVKRLRRLRANLVFEVLDGEGSHKLLEREASTVAA